MNELRQISTLVGLKSRLTFRSYARDTLAIIQSVFFSVFILIFAVLFAMGIIGTFYFLRGHLASSPGIEIMVLANLLWGIYGLWLLVPVFGFRINESYDISKLLHLPVRRVTLFISGLAGGLADLTIAIPLAALTGILILFTINFPTLGFNVLTLLIFLINMVIGGQLVVILIYNVLPRVPWYKILIGIIVIGALICWAWFSLQARVHRAIHIFDIEVGQVIYIYFPHGMATHAIWHAYTNNWAIAFKGLGWLILHTIGLGALTGVLFANWYATGNVEGTPVGAGGERRRSLAELIAAFWAWALKSLLPRQALEVMRKDHLYLLRNRNFLLYKTVPAVLGPGIVMFAIWYSTTHYPYLSNSEYILSCLVNAAIIFSTFIITAQANLFAGNIFGLEGEGIYSLFTTEVDKRMVLLGKDAFFLTLFVFDAAVFGGFAWLLLGKLAYGLMAFLFLLNLFILLLSTGNFTSALTPYYFDLERPAVSAQQVILLAIVEAVSAMLAIFLLIPPLVLIIIPLATGFPIFLILSVPLSVTYSLLWLWVSIRLAGPLVDRFEQMIMKNVSES